MKLIVGLGNPGKKYKNNRHNVGFQFIDYLIENLQPPTSNLQLPNTNFQIPKFKIQKKLSSSILALTSKIILAKPLTFMNLSGRVVKKLVIEYRLPITDLLIVHDDLDIPLGKFKIQKGVGPKLHNGIESIENALSTIPHFAKVSRGKDFWRVRIGVDNRKKNNWIDGETYVLQDFLPKEFKIISSIFPKIVSQLNKELYLN